MFDNHAKAVMDILQILFEMLGLILPGAIFINRYLNVFMVVEMEMLSWTCGCATGTFELQTRSGELAIANIQKHIYNLKRVCNV